MGCESELYIVPNPWLILAFIAVLAGTGWQGYRMGQAASEAAHDAEKLAAIEAGQKLDAERIALQRERDALADQLAEERNADPIVVERGLGPSRGVRLNKLR